MKNNWKKILNELSYRVSSGIPDLTNEQHLMKLWDILKEHNWNIDARVELLKNLDEAKRVVRHPGTTWVTASGHAGKRADGKSQYGLKSKEDFLNTQKNNSYVISMGIDEQKNLVL